MVTCNFQRHIKQFIPKPVRSAHTKPSPSHNIEDTIPVPHIKKNPETWQVKINAYKTQCRRIEMGKVMA